MAFRAFALDEAVGQEQLFFRVEKLRDGAAQDVPARIQRAVDGGGQLAVFFAVRAVVLVMVNEKAAEIAQMLAVALVDELLRRDAFLFRAQHDRRAVRVVGADIVALMPAQALEAYPDIGLDIFHHVAEVNRAVGIRQGAGDKNAAFFRVRHGKALM